MHSLINRGAVAALDDQRVDWRHKGLPVAWTGRAAAEIRAERPDLFAAGPLGPVCVLRADALEHNLATMAAWCARHGVELAPHGKTHMAPQLVARQFDAGACAVTAATISQVRTFRAFGVREVVLANELVDAAGLAWLAGELDADPDFAVVCWVGFGARGAVDDRCADRARARTARSTCAPNSARRAPAPVVATMRTPTRSRPRWRPARDFVWSELPDTRRRWATTCHPPGCGRSATFSSGCGPRRCGCGRCVRAQMIVTAGGSTHFDLVAEILTGDWRTVVRSGAYLTNDDGLYLRTSPLTRPGAQPDGLRAAMHVWAQVCSRPEPGLALLTMGRRDVSFDQDMPVPQRLRRGPVGRRTCWPAARSSNSTISTRS